MTDVFRHDTVLPDQAVNALLIDSTGPYIDATFGRGGHARLILDGLGADGRLLALDQDPAAAVEGRALADADQRFTFIQTSFTQLEETVRQRDLIGRVCGVLLDLGVSSPQLDDATRGFSFQLDGPLDMRMDPTSGISAADWINQAEEREIGEVLRHFGEEKFHRRMARAIVAARRLEPVTTTGRLAEIVKQANPAWEKSKHPATRAFQAIRIYINRELESLDQVLDQALTVLRIGGRLVVISFHSLEDKIVKKFISLQTKGDSFPRGVPVRQSELRPRLIPVGKPLRPSEEEISGNPRARSAVMRVAEKIA